MSKHRKIVKMFTSDDCTDYVHAFFTEGRHNIDFDITLDNDMIMRSRQGTPWQCILARGTMAMARAHPSIFPHPVKFAYVIGSTIYILTHKPRKIDQGLRAVRYAHNFTKKLRKYDNLTKPQFLEMFGDQGVAIRLRPVRKTPVKAHDREGRTIDRSSPRERQMTGAWRRAKDAGLLVQQL
jgi:hypothetical protein